MSAANTAPSYKDGLKELVLQLREMLPEDKLAVFNHDAERLDKAHASVLKLKSGDSAPLFSLPNAAGKTVSLESLLEQGAVVLTFYRGVWCPYCNLQLKTYQKILPQISAAGANLVAISPMTPDASLQMRDSNELAFEVLSDVGNKVARRFTTVFENPDSSIRAMSELGYDFHGFYGDSSAELPVPATFVIAGDRTVMFAASEGGDYRGRVEPQAIIDALAQGVAVS